MRLSESKMLVNVRSSFRLSLSVFVLFLITFLMIFSAAGAPPVVGDAFHPSARFVLRQEFLVDPTAELDIAQVSAAPWSREFKPVDGSPPSFGFTPAAVWMRCEVGPAGEAAESVRFELRSARISQLTWYVVADGQVEKSVAGGAMERSPGHGRYPAIEFEIPPGETRTVFARAVSDTSLLLPFEAGSPAVMRQVEWRRSAVNLLMAFSLILAGVVVILRARHHRQREEMGFFLAWLAFAVCIVLLTLRFASVLPVAVPLQTLQKLLIPAILAAFFLVASARQRSLQRMEIQLAETEARRSLAEEERDAKSLFLAEVSHEIRTPLSALVGLSQAMWLRCSSRDESDPEFTQFLNRVRSGGQYLSLLLRNVLNVSAAESGRVPVRLTTFYLADWVDEIRHILEPIADYHHGRILWTLPDDDEARLCTDEMRLTQIILNLAENARK